MDDIGDRFLELIHELEDVAASVTAQRALAEFDPAAVFNAAAAHDAWARTLQWFDHHLGG